MTEQHTYQFLVERRFTVIVQNAGIPIHALDKKFLCFDLLTGIAQTESICPQRHCGLTIVDVRGKRIFKREVTSGRANLRNASDLSNSS